MRIEDQRCRDRGVGCGSSQSWLADRDHRRRAVGEVLLAYLLASPLLARGTVVLCPFRRMTGHRCPLCGMTRSLAALLHGDLRSSAASHPLGWAVAVGTVACLLPIESPHLHVDERGRPWRRRLRSPM